MSEELEKIVHYNMDDKEALAYRISLLWNEMVRSKFPDRLHLRPKKNGDPRKSFLFKCCYRLVRETWGLLEFEQYPLYVKAQLDILGAVVDQNKQQVAEISPLCLAGDKAWVRWKIWKRKLDKKLKSETAQVADVPTGGDDDGIRRELERTTKFLTEMFQGVPSEEQFRCMKGEVERWIVLGKVSPYYAILSPWVRRHCNIEDIDLNLYLPYVSPAVKEAFGKMFSHESG